MCVLNRTMVVASHCLVKLPTISTIDQRHPHSGGVLLSLWHCGGEVDPI